MQERAAGEWAAWAALTVTSTCWALNAIFSLLAVGRVSPMLLVSLRWVIVRTQPENDAPGSPIWMEALPYPPRKNEGNTNLDLACGPGVVSESGAGLRHPWSCP